jgi:hypothetical protein
VYQRVPVGLRMCHCCRIPSHFTTSDVGSQVVLVPCRSSNTREFWEHQTSRRECQTSQSSSCILLRCVCTASCYVLCCVIIDPIMKIWPANIGMSVDSDSLDTGRYMLNFKTYRWKCSLQLTALQFECSAPCHLCTFCKSLCRCVFLIATPIADSAEENIPIHPLSHS